MAKGKKTNKKTDSGQVKKEGDSRTQEKEEKDYGGLPARDLKKNLGCGG